MLLGDMTTAGTDLKPLEIVFFVCNVASKNFLEQMKGRGARGVRHLDGTGQPPPTR